MDIIIEAGKREDIDELEKLYNDLNDYLAAGTNYPGWLKGVYPVRENAEAGVEKGCLYVARSGGRIAGTVILNQDPPEGYETVNWKTDIGYEKIIVVHTLAVHPAFIKEGVGKKLMEFGIRLGRDRGMESVRLDVFEKNLPAIHLYESCGFDYIATVDLGYGEYGLDWFKLYEKLL